MGVDLEAQNLEQSDYAQFRELEEFARLFEALDEMNDDLNLGQSEADIDWSRCMSDAGLTDYERQGDARARFVDEWNEAQSTYPWGSAEWTEMHSHFQERERELALIDLECRQSVNFQARQNERRIEIHTRFVSDHASELRALQDAIEQGRFQ